MEKYKKFEEVSTLLGRMYNWKLDSAYFEALEIKDFPKDLLEILKYLSDQFGNCGWQEGKVYNELREKLNIVADGLGFKWNEATDYWIVK